MKKKIIYLVTEDWYFCSHRLPVARAARDAGYDVVVATGVGSHGRKILNEGFRLIPTRMRRRGGNPFQELRAILQIYSIYQSEQPDIVHHVAVKPIVYGAIAASFCRIPMVINAFAGLGYVFTAKTAKARFISFIIRIVFRWILRQKNSQVVVQNSDDATTLRHIAGLGVEKVTLVPGSGVDFRRFVPRSDSASQGTLTVMMVARMIREKGVEELVNAARILKGKGVPLQFILVGPLDPDNPSSIPKTQLDAWVESGLVEWWGQKEGMPDVWNLAHIAVLPSYREGIPKALLEAASCGIPIITTDAPGCRDVVHDGENGLLVPVQDAEALAQAILKLGKDQNLRQRMGLAGRKRVQEFFSEEVVVKEMMKLYSPLTSA